MTEQRATYGRFVTLSVKMEESLRKELKIISAVEGKTISRIIIGLINDYVRSKRQEKRI